jgi:hypothetical protein
VDSASRYTWVITGKDRKDIVQCLQNWKKVVEKETDLKIMSVRIDNAIDITVCSQTHEGHKTLDRLSVGCIGSCGTL